MRKLICLALILCISSAVALAQAKGQPVKKQSTTTVKPAATNPAQPATAPSDALIALLPASELIAVVDINRLFNQLLPQLMNIQTGGLDKLAKDLTDFTQTTGIDPSKIQSAVLGLNLQGTQGSGALIVSGIDLNNQQIEAAMAQFKAEFKTSDYKGKTIYNLVSKVKSPEAGPLSVKTDEMALTALGGQRFAFGDLSAIKNVIDISNGEAKGGVSQAMNGALNETRESALLRFALNIPESLKNDVADQGDLFKSVGAIKMVLGTFDVAADFSLSLDALIRTASRNDASELESGLNGLVGLVKGIFGGGTGDPKTDLISQVLDQVKIGSKLSDVSLSISLPRSVIDQLTKKPAPTEKKP